MAGLAAAAAVALPITLVAATAGAPAPTPESTAGASSSPSFLEGQLDLVQARGSAEATAFRLDASPAAPVVLPATTTTVAPTTSTTAPPAAPAAPAPAPAPEPAPAPSSYGDPSDPATWDRLADCEASGNWAANTGNGYYGGLQFSLSSWEAVGGTGYPHQASRETQIEMGQRLYADGGWNHWPSCSEQLGYR